MTIEIATPPMKSTFFHRFWRSSDLRSFFHFLIGSGAAKQRGIFVVDLNAIRNAIAISVKRTRRRRVSTTYSSALGNRGDAFVNPNASRERTGASEPCELTAREGGRNGW